MGSDGGMDELVERKDFADYDLEINMVEDFGLLDAERKQKFVNAGKEAFEMRISHTTRPEKPGAEKSKETRLREELGEFSSSTRMRIVCIGCNYVGDDSIKHLRIEIIPNKFSRAAVEVHLKRLRTSGTSDL